MENTPLQVNRKVIYRFQTPMVEGRFIRRLNRFLAEVKLNGSKVLVHIPHTGRLPELLVSGRRCYVAPAPYRAKRKTQWTLALIESGNGALGCIDTRIPNKLTRMLAENRSIPGLEGWGFSAHEVKFGDSRIDLVLARKRQKRMLVEVKSVTWVVNSIGLFPDSPTLRGMKHLEHLIEAQRQGYKAGWVFVVQRDDAQQLGLAEFVHPAFVALAKKAQRAGVKFVAIKCKVSTDGVRVIGRVPLSFSSLSTRVLSEAKMNTQGTCSF